MHWYQEEEEYEDDEDLMFSPALLARRASESWIVAPPVEVLISIQSLYFPNFFVTEHNQAGIDFLLLKPFRIR